jgi:hypothetical protein
MVVVQTKDPGVAVLWLELDGLDTLERLNDIVRDFAWAPFTRIDWRTGSSGMHCPEATEEGMDYAVCSVADIRSENRAEISL